jgi:hypothetical protein
VAPAAGTQLSLFTPQTGRTGRLGWQLARLGLKFGEERVGWMELEDTEAALADERWSWRRDLRPAAMPRDRAMPRSRAVPGVGVPSKRRRPAP